MLVYFFIAFCLMLVMGKFFIASLAPTYFRSLAREDTPATHRAKDFTPTMGGLCMIVSSVIMIAAVATAAGAMPVAMAVLAIILIGFCAIGAWDDCNKIFYRKGISERKKFIGQLLIATVAMIFWYWYAQPSTLIFIPYIPSLSFDWGPIFFVAWCVWVILCTVNAVNFTDGLDGLATMILLANFVTFGCIALLLGYVDIFLFCMIVTAVLLGFLWYNAYPAQMFMGDAGSLPLGAALATVALMTKTELLIPLAGGIFVLEGVSVAAQIIWFKLAGKRIFKMAPIHHHFELLGYAETTITIRFFIVTIFLCLAALAIIL